MEEVAEDKTTLDAVHRLMLELAETSAKMKAMKSDLKDIADQNDEYRAIQEELKETTETVTYTHLPSPRDPKTARMPAAP